jgi:ketosteroid isomerase-like protein
MSLQEADTPLEQDAAERLSERFHAVFETFEAPPDLFAPDVLFDLNMPVWRFQIQGSASFATQLESINQGRGRVEILRTVPTASGFVTEHVEHQDVNGEDLSARRLWLCEVRNGRITEVVGYCSGEWNEALRQRHAQEAPMIRP